MLKNLPLSGVTGYDSLFALAGIVCHLGYFIRGEHHQRIVQWFGVSVLIPTAAWVAAVNRGLPVRTALVQTLSAYSIFVLSLGSSVAGYRLLWHPLSRFPGPVLQRLSSVFTVLGLKNFNNHFQLARLHQQYGDFVRIGNYFSLSRRHVFHIAHPLF